jgi:hypothetical protein
MAKIFSGLNFETRLPIGFDATANGVQHLALLIGDVVSAALSNLLGDGDGAPSDAYNHLIKRAIQLIGADQDPLASWWRERFDGGLLDDWQQRKLLKTPIVAFGYSAFWVSTSDGQHLTKVAMKPSLDFSNSVHGSGGSSRGA